MFQNTLSHGKLSERESTCQLLHTLPRILSTIIFANPKPLYSHSLAEDFNLELQYRKPFSEVWKEENHDPDLGQLADRMNVRDRNTGELAVSKEEMEAVSFYLGFCFYKV